MQVSSKWLYINSNSENNKKYGGRSFQVILWGEARLTEKEKRVCVEWEN